MPPVAIAEVVETTLSNDEAIALALSQCADGDSITLHEESCPIEYGECECTPRTYTKGAKA